MNNCTLALAGATVVLCLAWLGWAGAETRFQMRAAVQQAVRVSELRGSFDYLNEWLTMSARMAAETGDVRWIERYDEARPRLTAAIGEALQLSTPAVSEALAETTGEANRGLTEMERAAFVRVKAGDSTAARVLLNSPEFSYLEEVYKSGIAAFGQNLQIMIQTREQALDSRSWIEVTALGIGIVMLVATALCLRARAQLRQARARIRAASRTDALTELPNRRHLYERLGAAFQSNPGPANVDALLLLDIDHFRSINDVHGHRIGDLVLQTVASRIRTVARSSDLVVRLGGGEFAVFTSVEGQALDEESRNAASQIARRITSSFADPITLPGHSQIQVSLSVGIAFIQADDEAGEEVTRRADVALAQAKLNGRGSYCFFESDMDAQIRARAKFEAELRQAVEEEQIVPFFQPLIELSSGRLIGFEMLARWPHMTKGMISPAEFIPVVEHLELIGQMTEGLLRRACDAMVRWSDDLVLACNVSPLQLLDRDLPKMVRAALQNSGLAPGRLEIEITESALVGDLDLACELLEDLKSLGVRLALDDFGTGYSSLRHLKLLPFDKIKIDASFVSSVTSSAESRKIVAAVVGLGQSLGLVTVAEGVEEASTAAILNDLGCDVGQGWLFGRPTSELCTGAALAQSLFGEQLHQPD